MFYSEFRIEFFFLMFRQNKLIPIVWVKISYKNVTKREYLFRHFQIVKVALKEKRLETPV